MSKLLVCNGDRLLHLRSSIVCSMPCSNLKLKIWGLKIRQSFSCIHLCQKLIIWFLFCSFVYKFNMLIQCYQNQIMHLISNSLKNVLLFHGISFLDVFINLVQFCLLQGVCKYLDEKSFCDMSIKSILPLVHNLEW